MKIAIHTETQAQYDALMEFYDKQGLKWRDGENPKEYNSIKEGGESMIRVNTFGDGRITSTTEADAKQKKYTIIPFPIFAETAGIKWEEKPEPKKMTVAEIAKALGHEVEIIK